MASPRASPRRSTRRCDTTRRATRSRGTLTTYAMPSAVELPRFETARTETPTPVNPLGAKGIGESGDDRVHPGRAERRDGRALAVGCAITWTCRSRRSGSGGPWRWNVASERNGRMPPRRRLAVMSDRMPAWERRFRAPAVSMPRWARSARRAPLVVRGARRAASIRCTSRIRTTGLRRQVTDHPVGVIASVSSPHDGERVLFWQDETGSEAGRWYAEPFSGGEAVPFLAGVPTGWNQGLSQDAGLDRGRHQRRRRLRGRTSRSTGSRRRRSGAAPRISDRADRSSARGARAGCRPTRRCSRSSTPSTATACTRRFAWSILGPVRRSPSRPTRAWRCSRRAGPRCPGDQRLVVIHERRGRGATRRSGTSRAASGLDLDLGLAGPVVAVDWWPDAASLLVVQNDEGRDRLFRYDLARATLSPIEHDRRHDRRLRGCDPTATCGSGSRAESARRRSSTRPAPRWCGPRGSVRRRPAVPVVALRQRRGRSGARVLRHARRGGPVPDR